MVAAFAKSLTLIGMSGVGKTHLSALLESVGWTHYSSDLVIAEKYLAPHLARPATRDDLRPVSDFIGQLGNPALGGMPLAAFKERQRLYTQAESRSLEEAAKLLDDGGQNIVIDSTGSFCEIEDHGLLDAIGKRSLLVYLENGPAEIDYIFARARAYPKPLYFPSAHFDEWLASYMMSRKVGAVEEIMPNDFSAWVFPLLFNSRIAKFRRLAAQYGVTIRAASLKAATSADDILQAVAGALAAA